MGDANLLLLQETPQSSSVPLFLVHDGSGSVGSYTRLGAFARNTWAFENLTIQKSGMWDQCIPEIAELYCEMILEVYPEGNIILGGWSMGGLISLEMSQIFSTIPQINVIGVVMIESVYPGLLKNQNISVEAQDLCLNGKMSMADQKRAAKLIFEATRVAKSYESTAWKGSVLPPAPLMLIKARDPVPSRKVTTVPPLLGWDQLGDQWITTDYTVPGHHFSIFENENDANTTVDRVSDSDSSRNMHYSRDEYLRLKGNTQGMIAHDLLTMRLRTRVSSTLHQLKISKEAKVD